MQYVPVTLPVFQPERSREAREVQPENIKPASVTLGVSQSERSRDSKDLQS